MLVGYRVVFRSLCNNNIHVTLHCSSSISLTFCVCKFLSNLEEFQEARFGGARLPYHCHCRAEVVHILTVGIQHHGL